MGAEHTPDARPARAGRQPCHVADGPARKDEQLSAATERAFGAPPSATDDEAVLVDIAKALAAFQETLDSAPTPFDKFRDALARGERIAPWTYSDSAQRGLRIFIGKGGCNNCHGGPNFTNGEFHDNGFTALAGPRAPTRDGSRGSSA